ncbi:hypothetical protein PspLS_03527 [Pyricularia sp. CBS 133598]|nr:hypothetical protein PspLS_03527 [Pyricularia sp. CBS 133598]
MLWTLRASMKAQNLADVDNALPEEAIAATRLRRACVGRGRNSKAVAPAAGSPRQQQEQGGPGCEVDMWHQKFNMHSKSPSQTEYGTAVMKGGAGQADWGPEGDGCLGS